MTLSNLLPTFLVPTRRVGTRELNKNDIKISK